MALYFVRKQLIYIHTHVCMHVQYIVCIQLFCCYSKCAEESEKCEKLQISYKNNHKIQYKHTLTHLSTHTLLLQCTEAHAVIVHENIIRLKHVHAYTYI